MIQNVKAYPNYRPDSKIEMESTTYRLTIINNSNLSDIKVHFNTEYTDVLADSDRGIEKDFFRINANSFYTFNCAINSVTIASCTGEIVNVTLTTDLYAINDIPEKSINIKKDLLFSKSILCKLGSKVIYRLDIDDATRVRLSNDDFETDTKIIDFPNTIIRCFITRSGTILLWTNNTVLRSTDDAESWTQVIDDAEHFYNENAIDEGITGFIAFGEYGADGVDTKKVYYTRDDGITWSIKLEINHDQSTTEGIRHFHTCKFNPNNRKWYISSGDNAINVKWFESSDYKMSSVNDIGLPSSKKFINTAMFFTPDGYIIWSCDDIELNKTTGVHKVLISDLSPDIDIETQITTLLTFGGTSYCCEYINGYIISATYYSNYHQTGGGCPSVFISSDMGVTWEKIAVWNFTEGKEDVGGGFKSAHKDYANDTIYIYGEGDLQGLGYNVGKPNSLKLRLY